MLIKILTRFVIPLAILAGAAYGANLVANSAEPVQREPPRPSPPLVEVRTLQGAPPMASVVGSGVVEPARVVTISPEVSGKLVQVGSSVVVGGRVKRGDLVAKIDDTVYELSIRERRSQVQQARLEVDLERGRGKVAAREWDLLGRNGVDREDSALALREPQRQAAQVALESAQAALQRAEHDRSRTVLRAPFNATVVEETAELGQYVAPGTPIAKLYGTDAFWVRAQVGFEDLALLDLSGAEGGAAAVVEVDLGGGNALRRDGRVLRLVSEIAPESRTAQVLVEVTFPLDPPPGQLPLLPGAYARVEIQGKPQPTSVAVPREVLFEGRRVWVVDADLKLEPRDLEIVWESRDAVYATSGVAVGEQVLATPLPVVAPGMEVRLGKPGEAPAPSVEAAVVPAGDGEQVVR